MSDLPTREEVAAIVIMGANPFNNSDAIRVLRGYLDKDLQTEAEWRDSLDWNKLVDVVGEIRNEIVNNAPCCNIDRSDGSVTMAQRIVDAAFGEQP